MLFRRIAPAISLVVDVLVAAQAGVAFPLLAELHSRLVVIRLFTKSKSAIVMALPLVIAVLVTMGAGASTALAETHPFLFSFGSFTNPNGIAVDESTGDVYVADIGTNTISKFEASGNPVNFTCGAPCSIFVTGNQITGTPTESFAFPRGPGNPMSGRYTSTSLVE